MKISKRTFIKKSTKLIMILLMSAIFGTHMSFLKKNVYKKKNEKIWILDLSDN